MQFQHGTFTKADNNSLILTPFGVDGRQLLSNPCTGDNSLYTRYNQFEMFAVGRPAQSLAFNVLTDPEI